MSKKLLWVPLIATVLAGCASTSATIESTASAQATAVSTKTGTDKLLSLDAEDYEESYDADTAIQIKLDGSETIVSENGVTFEDGIVTISEPSTYVLSGTLDGSIQVNTENSGTVRLVLNGLTVTSTSGPAIKVISADKTILTSAKGTQNTVTSSGMDEDEETATIYAKDDLVINGSGTLVVNGNEADAIKANDTLYFVTSVVQITALDDGINANDLIGIQDAIVTIDAGGKGIKSGSSSDESGGDIIVDGGYLTIISTDHCIKANGDVTINSGTVNLTAGDGAGEMIVSTNEFGGQMPNMGNMQGGMMGPGGFDGQQGHFEPGEMLDESDMNGPRPEVGEMPDMNEMPSGMTPPEMDESFDPNNLPEEMELPEGMQNPFEQTSDDTDAIKPKGMNIEGDLYVYGGIVAIDAQDDGINTAGSVTIDGGTITIKSGDDGIHADVTLTINDGMVNIEQSEEGLEAKYIVFNDGDIVVNASDDGINSSDPDYTGDEMSDDASRLTINGGTITVYAYGDGVDMNGSGSMSGGTLVIYGPTSGADGALDYAGTFTVTGGTILAGGASGMAMSISDSSTLGAWMIGTSSGTITVQDEDGQEVLRYQSERSYSNLVIVSDLLEEGTIYTILEDGEELGTLEISTGTTFLNTNSNMMGQGGFGGHSHP